MLIMLIFIYWNLVSSYL